MESTSNPMNIATVWIRIGAFLIDFVIFWAIGTVIGFLVGTPSETGIGFQLTGFPAFTLMTIGVILWPISEGVYGQTIGKRLTNIKIVSLAGKPISMGQAFGRFFLGFFDYIFLIGIVVAILNKNNQRIGDHVANTLVIQTKSRTLNKRESKRND